MSDATRYALTGLANLKQATAAINALSVSEQAKAATLAAEYEAIGLRPLDQQPRREARFVIRRLPLDTPRTTPAWRMIDRERPAWQGAMYTQQGALRACELVEHYKSSTTHDGLIGLDY